MGTQLVYIKSHQNHYWYCILFQKEWLTDVQFKVYTSRSMPKLHSRESAASKLLAGRNPAYTET